MTSKRPNLSYKHIKLLFNTPARRVLYNGISDTANTVIRTLGPRGRNVLIETDMEGTKITKDGVTVANTLSFFNRDKAIGNLLLKSISSNTNKFAGDGTTTATILTYELIKQGLKGIESGVHGADVKLAIEECGKISKEFLKKIVIPVESQEEIFNVCMVSTNYDEDVSSVVAEALDEVGPNGNIEIEPSYADKHSIDIFKEARIQRGIIDEDLTTDKIGRYTEFDYPLILIVTNKIKEIKSILPILDKVKSLQKPLVIFSEDLQEEPLSTLKYNLEKKLIQVSAVNVPWLADVQKEILKDIAILTGATVIDNEYSLLENVTLDKLGTCRKIHIGLDETIIIGPSGNPQQIQQRIEYLQQQIDSELSNNKIKALKNRLSNMGSKLAILGIGGTSNVEVEEARDKIIDALNSAKAAYEEGILPGGGVALYGASKIIKQLEKQKKTLEERFAYHLFQNAIKSPMHYIIGNSGKTPAFIMEKVDQFSDPWFGYNLLTESVEHLGMAGIVDAHKIIRIALEDSISLANLILMTECTSLRLKPYSPPPLKQYQDRKGIF